MLLYPVNGNFTFKCSYFEVYNDQLTRTQQGGDLVRPPQGFKSKLLCMQAKNSKFYCIRAPMQRKGHFGKTRPVVIAFQVAFSLSQQFFSHNKLGYTFLSKGTAFTICLVIYCSYIQRRLNRRSFQVLYLYNCCLMLIQANNNKGLAMRYFVLVCLYLFI